MKLSGDYPTDRNSIDTKVWRREYAECYPSSQTVNTMKIFVDEFECNIHVKRSFARSIREERAYRPVATQPGRMQAVSANIIAERGANDQAYLTFDTAPGHRNIEEALGETFPIKRLSKYSPFLYLRENAFSCWKNDLKARLAENMHIFLNPDQNGRNGMTLKEFPFNKLEREIELRSRNVNSSEMPRMGESRDELCASLFTRRYF